MYSVASLLLNCLSHECHVSAVWTVLSSCAAIPQTFAPLFQSPSTASKPSSCPHPNVQVVVVQVPNTAAMPSRHSRAIVATLKHAQSIDEQRQVAAQRVTAVEDTRS